MIRDSAVYQYMYVHVVSLSMCVRKLCESVEMDLSRSFIYTVAAGLLSQDYRFVALFSNCHLCKHLFHYCLMQTCYAVT